MAAQGTTGASAASVQTHATVSALVSSLTDLPATGPYVIDDVVTILRRMVGLQLPQSTMDHIDACVAHALSLIHISEPTRLALI
eukprot:8361359-Alexandrium_andersonii.AAC.1